MSQKLKYFGHIKCHNGIQRVEMEGMVPGKWGTGWPKRRWTQDIKDSLNWTMQRAGELTADQDSFRRAVMRARFCVGHATWWWYENSFQKNKSSLKGLRTACLFLWSSNEEIPTQIWQDDRVPDLPVMS